MSWCSSKIGRILHNKTYAGYKGYRKSYTTDYLDHDRAKNLDRESYQYVKGNWEPIISEEQWNRVQKICAEKTKTVGDHTMGKNRQTMIWLNTLRCPVPHIPNIERTNGARIKTQEKQCLGISAIAS